MHSASLPICCSMKPGPRDSPELYLLLLQPADAPVRPGDPDEAIVQLLCDADSIGITAVGGSCLEHVASEAAAPRAPDRTWPPGHVSRPCGDRAIIRLDVRHETHIPTHARHERPTGNRGPPCSPETVWRWPSATWDARDRSRSPSRTSGTRPVQAPGDGRRPAPRGSGPPRRAGSRRRSGRPIAPGCGRRAP